jgi:hypothetical protein
MDPQEILKLLADLPIISEEPVQPPAYKTSACIYVNGATLRLYFFFIGEWHYIDFTA